MIEGFISIEHLAMLSNRTKAHSHDFWEIVYYTQGKGINRIGGQDIRFEDGCLVCQPPGLHHSEESEEGFRNIFLRVKKMDSAGVLTIRDSEHGELRQTITQMLYCYQLLPHNWENIMESLMILMGEYLVSRLAEQRKSRYVELCELSIADNISNPEFVLAETLDGIPLSNTYFMKLFKKETGLTPNDYLMKKRMDYAKRLLSNIALNNLRIKDIARMCGFADQYYFSKVFKKQTGVSPKLYMKGAFR